jgi:hypothetical protein
MKKNKAFDSIHGAVGVDQTLRNHTIYLQACVNYIGRQLGWRKYVRLAFGTAVAVGAFRGEIVDLYFLLRGLIY